MTRDALAAGTQTATPAPLAWPACRGVRARGEPADGQDRYRTAGHEAVQHVNSVQYFNKAHSSYAIIAVLNEVDVLTSGIVSGNRTVPGKPGTRVAAESADPRLGSAGRAARRSDARSRQLLSIAGKVIFRLLHIAFAMCRCTVQKLDSANFLKPR
jgi:hypothetical protein